MKIKFKIADFALRKFQHARTCSHQFHPIEHRHFDPIAYAAVLEVLG